MSERNPAMVAHKKAERFDRVTVDLIERWKESELSGDEWRFSYRAQFWHKGEVVASVGGASIMDALTQAVSAFSRVPIDEGKRDHYRSTEFCSQPGCPRPWTVLFHPIKAYDRSGSEYAQPYRPDDVRGFCERHSHRGDCGLDDADDNYTIVEERFPTDWAEEDA